MALHGGVQRLRVVGADRGDQFIMGADQRRHLALVWRAYAIEGEESDPKKMTAHVLVEDAQKAVARVVDEPGVKREVAVEDRAMGVGLHQRFAVVETPRNDMFRLDEILADTNQSDERLWVRPPHEPGVMWRPLMIDRASGSRVELLRVKRGGRLTKHLHPGAVHGFTIEGTWRYLEHDYVATPGVYLFEPPGDKHTLVCGDCGEMKALFFLNGPLIYVDADDRIIGHDDNMTILEKARSHYEAVGLGADYAMQFVR